MLSKEKIEKLKDKNVSAEYDKHLREFNDELKTLLALPKLSAQAKETITKYLEYQQAVSDTTDSKDELLGLADCIKDLQDVREAIKYDTKATISEVKLDNILTSIINHKTSTYITQFHKYHAEVEPLKVSKKDPIEKKIDVISKNLKVEANKNLENIEALRSEIDTLNVMAIELKKKVVQFKKGSVEYNKYGGMLIEVDKEIKQSQSRLTKSNANKNDIKDVALAIESLQEYVTRVDAKDIEALLDPIIKDYKHIFNGVYLQKFKLVVSKAVAMFNEQREHIQELNQHIEEEQIEISNDIESLLGQYSDLTEDEVTEEKEKESQLDELLEAYEELN